MKLWVKYFFAFMTSTLLTIAVTVVAIWGLDKIHNTTTNLVEINLRIHELANYFGKELAHSRRAEKEFFIFPNNKKKQLKYVVKWKKSYETIRGHISELETLFNITNNSEMLAMLEQARKLMAANEDEFDIVVDKYIATKSYDVVNKAEYGAFKEKTHTLEDIAVELAQYGLIAVKNNWTELKRTEKFVMQILLGISALAVIWGFLLPLILGKRLGKAIGYLTDVSNEISQGNLEERIEMNRKDELGQLAKAIQRMQKSLKIMLARQYNK